MANILLIRLATATPCKLYRPLIVDNEVALEFNRLQKVGEGDLVLQVQGQHSLDPVTEAGIGREKEEKEKLSNIIKVLNDRYNTDFTDADKLYFDQLEQALVENDDLKKRAQNNPFENFKLIFDEAFLQTLIDRMESNQDIFEKIMSNNEFRSDVTNMLSKSVYQMLNRQSQLDVSTLLIPKFNFCSNFKKIIFSSNFYRKPII